jgi:hypothetical protein
MADNPTLEVWKITIDVQKHFNELGLRVRSIAVTVLGAFLAAAGYALKEHSKVDFFGEQVSLTGTILLGALICWAAFFVMDRLWYHRLLKAAVSHGRTVENILEGSVPGIGLTGAIDEASPIWGMRAGHRLSIFYGFVAVLLWLGAGSALQAGSPYYVVGLVIIIIGLASELSARRGEVNQRRGFIRAGIVAGLLYYGWWGLTYWFASKGMPKYLAWSDEASKKGDWNTVTVWMKAADDAQTAMMNSIIWAIVVPIFALIVAALLLWINRGFRPTGKPAEDAAQS